MVDILRFRIAKLLVPGRFEKLEGMYVELEERLKRADAEVNQRVAAALLKMDPFEPLMRTFKGAFGDMYEHPEDRLNDASALRMMMWAHQQVDDPSFKFFIQWILDTEGNNFIRMGNPTPETVLFSRAMLAAPLLIRKEVQRLSERYADYLESRKGREFDPSMAAEE